MPFSRLLSLPQSFHSTSRDEQTRIMGSSGHWLPFLMNQLFCGVCTPSSLPQLPELHCLPSLCPYLPCQQSKEGQSQHRRDAQWLRGCAFGAWAVGRGEGEASGHSGLRTIQITPVLVSALSVHCYFHPGSSMITTSHLPLTMAENKKEQNYQEEILPSVTF